MTSERNDELLALYALGVPVAIIARDYAVAPSTLRKLASASGVRRPLDADSKMLNRVARAERMRQHIEEYPGTSLVSTMEQAA